MCRSVVSLPPFLPLSLPPFDSTPSPPKPSVEQDAGNSGDRQRGDPSSTAAVGLLSASHTEFSGDVLRVDASGSGAAGAGAVLIRASSAGQDVFEVAVRQRDGGSGLSSGRSHVGSLLENLKILRCTEK